MPTYDFTCRDCNHSFALLLNIKDRDKARCPICKSTSLVQRFTGLMYKASAKTDSGGRKSCSGKSCGNCAGC